MRGSFRTHSVVEVLAMVAWSLGETARALVHRATRDAARPPDEIRSAPRPKLRVVRG